MRQQLPAFAPLLEELEIAGWSAHGRVVSGNFHDWMLLGGERVLVIVGHAAGLESLDPTIAALVAQAAWTAIRAHALHVRDAGTLLTLAAQTLWRAPAAATRASVAAALVDTAGGQASVAVAGNCMAWRVRAASCEQLEIRQPAFGATTEFHYASHSIVMSLRERLILAAHGSPQQALKIDSCVADAFSQLDAESHRRMAAADAVALVRQTYQPDQPAIDGKPVSSASIAAIRRR